MSSISTSAPERVVVGGLPTVRLTRAGLAAQMVQDVRAQQAAGHTLLPRLCFSSNGQALALCRTDPGTRTAMALADYIHADGMPVVMASRLFTSAPLPERVATTDFFHDAAQAAQAAGQSFYFLGGTDEENQKAVAAAKALYPQLKIAGRHHGYWTTPGEERQIVQEIVERGTDVLWVNLGKPKQETFCLQHREALRGVGWLKTCGGLFKFLGGMEPRAPRWMQQAGLEWLYRVGQNPAYFAGRYARTNLVAAWMLMTRTGAPAAAPDKRPLPPLTPR